MLRRLSCQRITVAAATPSRVAAARQLIPSSTAASARDRRSIDNGLPIEAGLLSSQHPESDQLALGYPHSDFVLGGSRSNLGFGLAIGACSSAVGLTDRCNSSDRRSRRVKHNTRVTYLNMGLWIGGNSGSKRFNESSV